MPYGDGIVVGRMKEGEITSQSRNRETGKAWPGLFFL
jgi:hypothetical protein